jgi:hypothetical protein
MQALQEIIESIDTLITSADIDYNELLLIELNEDIFNDFNNQRIINSFLFNFTKLQDLTGAKLFKTVLIQLKEIDSYSIPMKDVLNILEKLNILNDADDWDLLREIRNAIAHEYPLDVAERIESLQMALRGYELLKKIFHNLKNYCLLHNLIQ